MKPPPGSVTFLASKARRWWVGKEWTISTSSFSPHLPPSASLAFSHSLPPPASTHYLFPLHPVEEKDHKPEPGL